MSRIANTAVVGLLSAFCLFGAYVPDGVGAEATKPQEVEQRLELNAATVDQIAALGVVTKEEAAKIVELREQLGNLQAYEDLKEADLSTEKIDALRPLTTINYMATDCNC